MFQWRERQGFSATWIQSFKIFILLSSINSTLYVLITISHVTSWWIVPFENYLPFNSNASHYLMHWCSCWPVIIAAFNVCLFAPMCPCNNCRYSWCVAPAMTTSRKRHARAMPILIDLKYMVIGHEVVNHGDRKRKKYTKTPKVSP